MSQRRTRSEGGLIAQIGQVYEQPPWTLAEAGLALLVLGISMTIIASAAAAVLSSDKLNPSPGALIMGWALGLLLTAAFALVRWRHTQSKFEALGIVGESARSTRPLLLLVMIGVAAALAADLLASFGASLRDPQNSFGSAAALQGLSMAAGYWELAATALFIAVIEPASEGIIFFGIVEPRLRSSIGAWPGLLTSVLVYAGFHYLIYGARPIVSDPLWYGFVHPFLLGLVLAVVRVWMNSTRGVIAAYMGIGITAFLVMLASG